MLGWIWSCALVGEPSSVIRLTVCRIIEPSISATMMSREDAPRCHVTAVICVPVSGLDALGRVSSERPLAIVNGPDKSAPVHVS